MRLVQKSFLASVIFAVAVMPAVVWGQITPVVEKPIAFDPSGRIQSITPALVNRLQLGTPSWPVSGNFREARLYSSESGQQILVVNRTDGSVERYLLSSAQYSSLSSAIVAGLALGTPAPGSGTVVTGLEASQPAGNIFVRNQTLLGLMAYGPATSAMLSKSGTPAAAGGYFLAAGTSFFIAAHTVKNRSVTRAQASLASHAGFRGGLAGAAVAAIANADDGPGFGAPILVGAVGGTLAGYRMARNLSDGEARSAGFAADLAAATTIGIAGLSGALKHDSLTGSGKTALGASILSATAGYLIGPQYARHANYNVTTGDIAVTFTSSVIGALAATAVPNNKVDHRVKFATATGGMLAGAFLSDRFLVRKADRSSSDGGLAQLGALAGGLMGGGLSFVTKSESQATMALIAAGGAIGLVAADKIIDPANDAGPLRGVMQTSSAKPNGPSMSISTGSLITAVAMHYADKDRAEKPANMKSGLAPAITSIPVVRIVW